jgi:WhiB family redox-sensing transcriptional regulator
VNVFTFPVAKGSLQPVTLTWTRNHDWDQDDWRDRSACRDTDPDLFFPVGTTGPAVLQIETAKSICRSCDAQADCLEFALATNQESGIWGGVTEDERRRLRRQWLARQRQQRAAAAAAKAG